MTFKNVEKLEVQEIPKKSWSQKFRNKFAPTVVVTGGLIAANAHADDTVVTDFLSSATSSLSGIAVSLGALFVVAIGITLTIVAFSNSRGGIRKAG